METDHTETRTYTSLADIRRRRDELSRELRKQERAMGQLWSDLFHREERPATTRAAWIARVASNSAGVIDAALLGWKLYRRFFAKPARRGGRR